MSIEVELKLLVAKADAERVAIALPGVLQGVQHKAHPLLAASTATLLNAYYETPQQWFRQHDFGLRTRLKHGQFEQTIKLAGQQHGAAHIRPEYNLPCQSVLPELAAFPTSIWPEGTDVAALQAGLRQLFRTDFQRQRWLLTDDSHNQIEVVLDQGWVQADTQQQAILELELELVTGDASALFVLARQLMAKWPLRLGFQSKAERGYRLRQQQPLSWRQVALDASIEEQLRALQQNLHLQQDWHLQHSADPTAFDGRSGLSAQWLQLQQSLLQCAVSQVVPEVLLTQCGTDLAVAGQCQQQLWLLELSAWLVGVKCDIA